MQYMGGKHRTAKHIAANEELLTKLQADFMAQQAKLQVDLAKKRLDLASKVPEVPVFNSRRTFV